MFGMIKRVFSKNVGDHMHKGIASALKAGFSLEEVEAFIGELIYHDVYSIVAMINGLSKEKNTKIVATLKKEYPYKHPIDYEGEVRAEFNVTIPLRFSYYDSLDTWLITLEIFNHEQNEYIVTPEDCVKAYLKSQTEKDFYSLKHINVERTRKDEFMDYLDKIGHRACDLLCSEEDFYVYLSEYWENYKQNYDAIQEFNRLSKDEMRLVKHHPEDLPPHLMDLCVRVSKRTPERLSEIKYFYEPELVIPRDEIFTKMNDLNDKFLYEDIKEKKAHSAG